MTTSTFNHEKFKKVLNIYTKRIYFWAILVSVIVSGVLLALMLVDIYSDRELSLGITYDTITAIGWITISTVNSIGLIAVGSVNSIGLIAIGGVNSVGLISIGGLNSIGLIAISSVNSIGLIAISGNSATGFIAISRNLLGEKWSITWGVYSLSYINVGKAKYMFSPNRQDTEAVSLFTRWLPRLKEVFSNSA